MDDFQTWRPVETMRTVALPSYVPSGNSGFKKIFMELIGTRKPVSAENKRASQISLEAPGCSLNGGGGNRIEILPFVSVIYS